jgi:hypothetical protein
VGCGRFGFLAKKGLNYLQGKFSQMIFDIGFVIEGRADEELPEQVLGVTRFSRLDYMAPVDIATVL